MVSLFMKAFTIVIIAYCIYIFINAKEIPSKDLGGILILLLVGIIPLLICNIFVEIEDANRTL